MREVIDAFRETGGRKPMFLQVTLSFAPTDAEAEAVAMDQWRQGVVGPEKLADLRSPADFDRESAAATPAEVGDKVRICADVRRHLDWLREDLAMGFERVYVHNVARDHLEPFINAWAEHVLPALR
jgi:alkanesulfonate monooxygenase SsuD/methylene tetrahydromethanopterin reductase-like flavin-dependent oxidoreductase (luciferase family)